MTQKLHKIKFQISLVVVLLIFAGFQACKGDTQGGEQDKGTVQDSTQVFGTASVQLPKFTKDATTIVNDWSIFYDFEEELIALNTQPIEELRSRSERFIGFADSLAKTLPDTLNIQPIASRLLVLNTRVKILAQTVQSQRPNDSIIHSSFVELNVALGNLKHQINEKLQKDKIDAQRIENEEEELEKQRSILDSIAEAEGTN